MLLRLFVNQVVTLEILKIGFIFLISRFSTWPKSQNKNLNIFQNEKSF